jgi:hypothetical protein
MYIVRGRSSEPVAFGQMRFSLPVLTRIIRQKQPNDMTSVTVRNATKLKGAEGVGIKEAARSESKVNYSELSDEWDTKKSAARRIYGCWVIWRFLLGMLEVEVEKLFGAK